MVYAAVLKAVLNWVSVRIRMGVQNWSVRLAGPGREIFILKITGSNPVPTTIIKYLTERLNVGVEINSKPRMKGKTSSPWFESRNI